MGTGWSRFHLLRIGWPNQIEVLRFKFLFSWQILGRNEKMAESETFFIFYQVGIDCWVPTYLPACFGRARRQRRNFLSTFKACRIANALAHDNPERKYVVLLIVIHFQNFHLPLEFSSGTNQTNVYHLFHNRNFREFVVNGKQPLIILMTKMLHFNLVSKLLSGYSSSPRQRLVRRTVWKTLIEFLYTIHTSLRIHMFPYG